MNVAYTPAIRAAIQFLAGVFAKQGYDVGSDIEPVVSTIVLLGTLVWSVLEKNKIKKSTTK